MITFDIFELSRWLILPLIFSNFRLSFGNIVEESKCKEDVFSKPYVLLREKKDGPDISKLEQQGVLDLRDVVRHFACINGAVIIYKDGDIYKGKHDEAKPGLGLKHVTKVDSGKTVKFSNGTFKIFSHTCIPMNWVPTGESASTHNNTAAFKTAGIFLITSKEPPPKPSENGENGTEAEAPWQIMFNQRAFGYKMGKSEGMIMDASFITKGIGPYCIEVESHKIILTPMAQNESEICRWSPSEAETGNTNYQRFFRKAHPISDYKWVNCSEEVNVEGGNGTEANVTGHKPFATFEDPGNVALDAGHKKHSKNGSHHSGEVFKENPKAAVGPQTYHITLGNCVKLPEFNADDPTCKFLNAEGDSKCPKLAVALELGESSQKGEAGQGQEESSASNNSSVESPFLTMEDIPSLKWKHKVLLQVGKLFSKLCLPIKRESVFRLMRVISNYLANAHTPDPEMGEFSHRVQKSGMWGMITARLHRCNEMNETKSMDWELTGAPPPILPTDEQDRKKRGKREVEKGSLENSFDALVLSTSWKEAGLERDEHDDNHNAKSADDPKLDPGDAEDKLIIQRSPSIFDFNDDNDLTNEFVYGPMPRWRRNTEGNEIKVPLPFAQEYVPPKEIYERDKKKDHQMGHQDFVIFPESKNLRIKGHPEKELFFYEDLAQVAFTLNPLIDTFWKIVIATLAYCQKYEKTRESAVYPLAYTNFDQYFLTPIKEEWTRVVVPQEINMVLGEFGDDDRKKWLDTCVETAFILGDALHFRSARPLELNMEEEGGEEAPRRKVNQFVDTPEKHEKSGKNKYFTKESIMPKVKKHVEGGGGKSNKTKTKTR